MADVTKIPGTTPNEPRGPREPAKPGSEKFKELMKVDKSGEGPKKRKKRQEEAEEETKAELRTGAATPEKQVEGVKKAEKFPKIQKVGEAEKRQPQPQKRPEESTPADEEAAIAANTQKLQSFNLDKVETVSVEKPGAQRPVYTESIAPQEEAKETTAQQIKETEEEKITARKQVKKEEVGKQVTAATVPPAASTLGPSFIPPPSATAPGYTSLNSEMLALFEKMVGQITIMLEPNGPTETTINLNSPEYAKSMFYGAQIKIKEYSTAPRAYNIEFYSTERNNRFFRKNIPSLRAAFQGEKRFSIHTIETSLLPEESEEV
ncbi:MAG: hypothetical protein JSS10_05430 [Verrucomicrobia bacterium]|nr:hypothetical protein [Verrucomicrobiota bacterium]